MDKQFNRELFTVDEEKFVKMTKEFTDATKWYYEPINSARVSEGYDEEGEKRLFLKSKSSHLLNGNGKQSLPIRAGIGGVTIGEYSMIGAGSVVTKDVGIQELWFGNPAKFKGYVCKCGQKCNETLVCNDCEMGGVNSYVCLMAA